MKTLNYYLLTKENVFDFLGKKVEFTAESYEHNLPYRGTAIITAIDFSKEFPISCECLSGDDLRFAFLDDHGLETSDGGDSYQISNTCTCFSYSDRYREIFIAIL